MTSYLSDTPVEFERGVYRHYKGGLYLAIGIVREHDTRRPWVLYHAVEHGGPDMSIRPLDREWDGVGYDDDCWNDWWTDNGELVWRFAKAYST